MSRVNSTTMDAPASAEFVIDDDHKEQFHDAEASARPPMPDEPPPPYPEHSLPTPEEAINLAAFKGLPYRHKRNVCLFVTTVLALTAIIGFSAGIAVSNRNRATNAASMQSGPVAGQPSSAESMDRLQDVKDFLSSFSSRTDLDTNGSPQFLAAQWIAVDDKQQLPVPASTTQDAIQFVQRYVMAVFYYSLDGANWDYASQSRFLSSTSECK